MEAKESLLFFSYARADAEFALKLANSLRSAGANLWIDQLDILAGDHWDRAVEQALKIAESLLIILSPKAVDSKNVMDEVSFALSKNKRIVPVLYKACEIPFRLQRIQHVDFTKDFNQGLERLLNDLAIKRPTERPQPEPPKAREILKPKVKLPEHEALQPKPATAKRQAVIVGIDKYIDSKIQFLSGAVNDATEMHQILKEFGNFDVYIEHFLLGEQATHKAIRKAISDLFWQTDSVEIALFYFSAHSFLDSYGNAYLAPFDMELSEPSVSGINVKELMQFVSNSFNKEFVLIILDCSCSLNVIDRGDLRNPFETFCENLAMKEGKVNNFILASDKLDPISRNINAYTHENGRKRHPHGALTFHLLEGLGGKAADQNGIITLGNLASHVEKELRSQGLREYRFYAGDVSRLERIRIAVNPSKAV